MTDEVVRAVLLTGPVGSGKTVVAQELGELLAARDLPSAVIDLDWLGWFQVGTARPTPDEMIVDNLRAVWPRFKAAGVRYLVLARALTRPEQIRALEDALPGVDLTVARVVTSSAAIAERLGRRDAGEVLREHLEAAAEMATALDEARLEDVAIENERAPARAAAEELLRKIGWDPEPS